MAELKDLILTINNQVNSNELSALAGASGISNIEVGDDTITEVKTKLGSLMSKEAAQNSPEMEDFFKKKLHPTIKGELLGNLDTDILGSAKAILGDEKAEKLKDIDFTGDKIKQFTKMTQELIASSSSDSELKKVNEQLANQINTLKQSHIEELSKKDKEIQKQTSDFNNRLIKKEFKSVMSGYELGDKYKEDFVKRALEEDVFKQVQKKAKLTLNKDGVIIPKNAENPDLDLFVENQKIETLKGVLDPIMSPFIKKTQQVTRSQYTPAKETKKSTLALDHIKRREQANA